MMRCSTMCILLASVLQARATEWPANHTGHVQSSVEEADVDVDVDTAPRLFMQLVIRHLEKVRLLGTPLLCVLTLLFVVVVLLCLNTVMLCVDASRFWRQPNTKQPLSKPILAEAARESNEHAMQLQEKEIGLNNMKVALERSKMAEDEKNKLIKQLQSQLDAYDCELASGENAKLLQEKEIKLNDVKAALARSKMAEEEKDKLIKQLQSQLDAYGRTSSESAMQLQEKNIKINDMKAALESSKIAEEEKSDLIKQLQSQLDAYDRERAR